MSLFKAVNNMTHTENNMMSYKSSLDACVDLFFKIGASRGKNLSIPFKNALNQNKDIAMRILLWGRDIRGGTGERQLFRDLVKEIPLTEKFISLIPEVGRWDDLLALRGTINEEEAVNLIRKALFEDKNGLCAKWMPRKGKKSIWLRNRLGLTPKQYRKLLVKLTDVVESKMTKNEWEEIEYEKVPSLASARYQSAFNKHDSVGYGDYKKSLEDKTTKINAGAVYPYDVLKSLYTGDEIVAQAQWEALPDYVENGFSFLPVIDVSGSMGTVIAGSLSALIVAVSLGLYLSEHNKGIFKDQFITFSQTPEMHKVFGTLKNRIGQIKRARWSLNTDLEAVFKVILNAAKMHKVPEEEMPSALLILSDMQFDQATTGFTALDMIEKQYKRAGYSRPGLVFWNLCDRSGNIPVTVMNSGVALVSGFSTAIMKTIMAGDIVSPELLMKSTVCIPRYDW